MLTDAMPVASAILVADLLRFAVFAWLWRNERAPYLGWWALAFALSVPLQAAVLTAVSGVEHPVVQAIAMAGSIATTLLLMRGTFALVGQPARTAWWAVAAGIGLLWGAAGIALRLPTPLSSVGLSFFLGAAHVYTAWTLARAERRTPTLGLGLSVGALAIMGVHYADFPVVGLFDALVPWGLALHLMALFTMTLGFALLHSERSSSERARAELRLDELALALDVGLFHATLDGTIIEANPALLRLLGCADLDAVRTLAPLTTTVVDLANTPFETPPGQPGERVGGVPTVWRRADGEPIPVLLALSEERTSRGDATGLRGIVIDRTRAAALENRIREAQKLDAIGQLAAGVAHDFNNLLMVIGGSMELLDDGTRDPDDRAILYEARQAVDRAAWVTSRLLAFGRRETEGATAVHLAPIVEQTATLLDRTLGRRYALRRDALDPSVHALIDPKELEQAILNLVINARDAMPDGGRIELSLRRGARDGVQGAELIVADSGVGISASQRDRLFEPFYTTKEPGRGTGLGLPIVHGLATRAGGVVEVESAPGEGATFTVWLPTVEPHEPHEPHEPA